MSRQKNVNTKEYWDRRFSANGDWESCGGREQTRAFAETQVRHLPISAGFRGSILDFGCGLGDGIPVYHRSYPMAQLHGIDLSVEAITKCREVYGSMASFVAGDHTTVPNVDIIIASNVMEHLSDDKSIVKVLLKKCKHLFVVVPYRERLGNWEEHVNSYDRHYFDQIGEVRTRVFASPGWSQYGWRKRWWNIHLKNIKRLARGQELRLRNMQILFHLRSESCGAK